MPHFVITLYSESSVANKLCCPRMSNQDAPFSFVNGTTLKLARTTGNRVSQQLGNKKSGLQVTALKQLSICCMKHFPS